MKTLSSVVNGLIRSPLKSVLTLFTVGLGVGVLIFSLGVSFSFRRLLGAELARDGLIVTVSNAAVSESTGELEVVRPAVFDESVLEVLTTDLSGARAISPVTGVPWSEVVVGNDTWRIRSALGTDAGYGEVMGLELAAGSFYTAADVEGGAKKAVISESLAILIWGSAEAALGQTIRSPASTTTGQTPGPRGNVMPTLTVNGVYADVSELRRTAYGIGDLLVPYTAALSGGGNREMRERSAMSTVMLRVEGTELATLEAQVRSALAARYGDDVDVAIWEGTPRGETTTIASARSTVATFSVVVNFLGFVLLVTGASGILSIMIVEVLGRSREIATQRALGASRRAILREYMARSTVLAALSSVIGVALALVFSGPLERLVLPIFNGVTAADLGGGVVSPLAVGLGVAAALLVGGVIGVFPVLPALRANVVEGMREAA